MSESSRARLAAVRVIDSHGGVIARGVDDGPQSLGRLTSRMHRGLSDLDTGMAWMAEPAPRGSRFGGFPQ